jgi:hypothetical protein
MTPIFFYYPNVYLVLGVRSVLENVAAFIAATITLIVPGMINAHFCTVIWRRK